MSLYKELSYDTEVDTIKGIQFSVMSPEEIVQRSVVEVTTTEVYNGNEPVRNGLFDPRMGVIDHNKVCVTCEQKNTMCPGHFGHITLAKPVFHVQYYDIVKKLFKCVCFRCSKLLVDKENKDVKAVLAKKINRQKRWEMISKLCAKVKRCGQTTTDGCGAIIPSVSSDSMLKIALEWKTVTDAEDAAKKVILTAEDVLKIFRRISDEDADVLGFNPKFVRPEWLICTVLSVPPPAVRPSVRSDRGERQEDDLTHKLLMIIKANKNLQAKIDKGAKEQIDWLTLLLQYDVATLIDNTVPGIPQAQQRTGRPIRSLTERLKSKEGRIRGNLMGKRVDFSARSVITVDPNISIDELGVPLKIAMNMVFPEVVCEWNIDEMRQFVRNGPDMYPGAKIVHKKDEGKPVKLMATNKDMMADTLKIGDTVHRHMRNGDYVLFNRQPSLHKMSMMGHRVRVMPYNTFRLNVCCTPSYNADFDGDYDV